MKKQKTHYQKYKPAIIKAISKYSKSAKGKLTFRRFEQTAHRKEYKRIWMQEYRKKLKNKQRKGKST
jgi:hypothetical protein